MGLRSLFSILFATSALLAQEVTSELETSSVALDNFPVRLTPEEEQLKAQAQGCCPPPAANCCPPACCKPPSINCPPLMPYCNPCDCIIDYYPPLIFSGVDMTIEFLYWTVQQKASTFVLTPQGFHQPNPPSTVADSMGKYQSAHFDWNPGVRGGFGYTFERDAWHMFGQYTYFITSGTNKIYRSDDPTLYLQPTLRDVNLSPTGIETAFSHISFHYQTADLLLSRRYLPGCQVLFNLFTGATGAWIHEKWKVGYSDLDGVPLNITTIDQNSWRFKGGGIRAGLDANWHMGSGFGLFNKVSFAGLVGSYHNTRKTVLIPPGIVGPPPVNNPARATYEEDTWVVPHTQLELGLNWNHRFRNWSTGLQAAFEINTWYDLHQLHQDATNFTSPNNNKLDIRNASDVKLWGLTVSADFNF